MRFLAFACLCATGLAAAILVYRGDGIQPSAPAIYATRPAVDLRNVTTWGYQLQNVRSAKIADDIDLLVVDYARDGSRAALTATDLALLRTRVKGAPRIVLCYLSIGEAENYRDYWQVEWRQTPPRWLGAENPQWKGNFAVEFWSADWQRLFIPRTGAGGGAKLSMFTRDRKPLIDSILEAGFDGVYLDRVDAFASSSAMRADPAADMRAFVTAISDYAKSKRPNFLIVPQNAEELLGDAAYRQAIDGIAKEDLLFGVAGDGVANDARIVKHSVALLNRAKAEGRPVFVVEYLADPAEQGKARAQLTALGYVSTFAPRRLDAPPEPITAEGRTGATR